jgi:hypothetical protein
VKFPEHAEGNITHGGEKDSSIDDMSRKDFDEARNFLAAENKARACRREVVCDVVV